MMKSKSVILRVGLVGDSIQRSFSQLASYLMGIKADEHVLVIDDVYGGTQRYFRKIVSQVQHTDFTFADFTDPEVFKSSFKDNTKVGSKLT